MFFPFCPCTPFGWGCLNIFFGFCLPWRAGGGSVLGMTTVVAVESAEGVVFASDTRVGGYYVNDGNVEKVVSNGCLTFGTAGFLRAIQVLQYASLPVPPVDCDPVEADRFVTKELVPEIRRAFNDADEKSSLEGSAFLASVRGRVYDISGDGAWVRNPNGFYAIGSGAKFALGALASGASAEEAVRVASVYDSGTNDDVRVVRVGEGGVL